MFQEIEMDEDDAAMLQIVQAIKSAPNYCNRFSETTRCNFDLYERALNGDAEAVSKLSIPVN